MDSEKYTLFQKFHCGSAEGSAAEAAAKRSNAARCVELRLEYVAVAFAAASERMSAAIAVRAASSSWNATTRAALSLGPSRAYSGTS
jgi:hypothetical protein